MIYAATGHRPDKLGGYSKETSDLLYRIAYRYISRRRDIEYLISGMALGWDTAWAKVAVAHGVPLVCALPFHGQEERWSVDDQNVYYHILKRAQRVEYVCTGRFAVWKYQARNCWMVDEADQIVALWDGSEGGTANCVKYAFSCKPPKPVENLWPKFVAKCEV